MEKELKMSDEKTKLKPLSDAMKAVANGVMDLRSDPTSDFAKQILTDAIVNATPELVASGYNVFNTGPALLAIENCKSYAGALVVHYELDKLRRMLQLEKPVQLARGPGSR
jgi:hypothetical protein